MFLARKPSERVIREFLQRQEHQELSYSEPGISRMSVAAGYVADHNRIRLGTGKKTFEKSMQAVRSWEMFHLGWVQVCWPDVAIEVGATVALLVRHWSFWSLNACRIVYLIKERGAIERYGFAYGTLPDHGESGEERFTVEWREDDDSVWYDLVALSRPNHWLAKAGYPLSRHLQRRFAEDSKKAMQRAVSTITA